MNFKQFLENKPMNPYSQEVDEFEAVSNSIASAINQMLTEFGDDNIQSFQQQKPGQFTIRTPTGRTYHLTLS
jgi:hypothetical protein